MFGKLKLVISVQIVFSSVYIWVKSSVKPMKPKSLSRTVKPC